MTVGAAGTAIRYQAGTATLLPSTVPTSTTLLAVQMVSPTEGYAVGGNEHDRTGAIAQWDGTTWHQVVSTPFGPLRSLAITGPGSRWAGGASRKASRVHTRSTPGVASAIAMT